MKQHVFPGLEMVGKAFTKRRSVKSNARAHTIAMHCAENRNNDFRSNAPSHEAP
jgi:hypothetical protein